MVFFSSPPFFSSSFFSKSDILVYGACVWGDTKGGSRDVCRQHWTSFPLQSCSVLLLLWHCIFLLQCLERRGSQSSERVRRFWGGWARLMGRVISCRSCWPLAAAGGQHQLQCRSAATPRVRCSEVVPSQCLATKQTGTSKSPINQQNASLPTRCC